MGSNLVNLMFKPQHRVLSLKTITKKPNRHSLSAFNVRYALHILFQKNSVNLCIYIHILKLESQVKLFALGDISSKPGLEGSNPCLVSSKVIVPLKHPILLLVKNIKTNHICKHFQDGRESLTHT